MRERYNVRTISAAVALAIGGIGVTGCGLYKEQQAGTPGLYGAELPDTVTQAEVDTTNLVEGTNHISFVRGDIAKVDMHVSPDDAAAINCGKIVFRTADETGDARLIEVDGSFKQWEAHRGDVVGVSCNYKHEAISENQNAALEQVDKLIPDQVQVSADY